MYISTTAASLLTVWKALEPLFADPTLGVTSAKRTTPEAAAYRPDSIVVYLLNQQAKRIFIGAVRQRLFSTRPGVGLAPPIPPKLTPAYFKQEVPALTKPINGLKGFSHAQQPLDEKGQPNGKSFGDQIAVMLCAAFLNANNDVAAFRQAVAKEYEKHGLNPDKPWRYS